MWNNQSNSISEQSQQIQIQKGQFNEQQSGFFNGRNDNAKNKDSLASKNLINFLQITIIIVLLLFISAMALAIFKEVNSFWFSNQIDRIDSVDSVDSGIESINLLDVKREQKPSPEEELVPQNQVQNQDQNQLQKIKNMGDIVDEDHGQIQIYDKETNQKNEATTQNDKSSDQNKELTNENDKVSNIKNGAVDQKKQKVALNMNQMQKLSNNQPQTEKARMRIKLSQRQEQKKIAQHTNFPDNSDKQLYDPVLVQLKRARIRFGNNFKQTIYTMKNTSISYSQYERAKKLTQIMDYFNPKQRTHIVKDRDLSEQCMVSGVSCQQKQEYIDSIVEQQTYYFQHKYGKAFRQLTQQLPFCIIVPSYKNNKNQNYRKNLNSILQQNYHNFHIVYIDDASEDGTAESIREYIKTYEIPITRLKLIQNQHNQKALKNIHDAAHNNCKQKQIMIIVDGDDYLIGTQVLRLLNFQYQTKRLLASYTNYLRINQPYYVKVGTSTPYAKMIIQKRLFRSFPRTFRSSHLRSFFVDLFRKIKPEDLKDDQGQFFTAANDFSIMMPILQMASPYIAYLPQLTYLYDSGTGLNNFQSKKEMQERNVKTVSKRKKYDQVQNQLFFPATL